MTKITKGTFELDGPMTEFLDGKRRPLYHCANCDGAFEEENGKGVAWNSRGFACCSEICATLFLHRD
jgi:hypothetical protein